MWLKRCQNAAPSATPWLSDMVTNTPSASSVTCAARMGRAREPAAASAPTSPRAGRRTRPRGGRGAAPRRRPRLRRPPRRARTRRRRRCPTIVAAPPGLLDGEEAGEGVEAGQGAREGRREAFDELVAAAAARTRRLGQEDAHLDVVDGEHLEVPRREVHRLGLRARRPAARVARRTRRRPDQAPGHDADGVASRRRALHHRHLIILRRPLTRR
ncbi:hypothetical protein PAHAL_6G009800 [Panicum hallii]|jgi:hypothetical protein|uniref:Uncharacterized protein n=1 Tax=Panicum hallii TaxID=206008 RepID=A0A2T8IEQ2_9POAL|nr:hypothetical protein PAHAL_6G009800 [Panicum hallii]